MWHLTIARRHKVLTFVLLIVAGAGLGWLIDQIALCAIFGAIMATCMAYGQAEPRWDQSWQPERTNHRDRHV